MNELAGGACCPTGREQVIDHQDTLALSHRVRVNLKNIFPVFELVSDLASLGGKLAGLANRHEARAEPLGEGRFAVWLPDEVPTNALFAAVRGAGGVVRSLTLRRRSLEEVFLSAVRAPDAAGFDDAGGGE